MREVNFSIPNANKASVGITTALYDRRALDCTSTLPLINSLNHLAYLTTSSARIRDILTIDGGVERLVCILKEGRSKDMMEMWKWNLAFQCVVNIGVRGSENVRTRVVEADMVPVIATILDNYIKVIDRCRERAEADLKRSSARIGSSGRHPARSDDTESSSTSRSDRTRRQAPPPITIPQPFERDTREIQTSHEPAAPSVSSPMSSPPQRTNFARHRPHRSHEGTQLLSPVNGARRSLNASLATAVPVLDGADSFGIRQTRDGEWPPQTATLRAETTSQPESPTTPLRSSSPRVSVSVSRRDRVNRRPSIRHQLSISGDADIARNDEMNAADAAVAAAAVAAAAAEPATEPLVGLPDDMHMQDIVDGQEMLDTDATPVALAEPATEGTDTETFNITHRSAINGSIVNPTATPTPGPMAFSPAQPTINVVSATPPPMQAPWFPRYAHDRNASSAVLAAMPRDEDVLMSLQLLAYVSKYCNLRSYFQQSHLVPLLKIGADLALIDGDSPLDKSAMMTEDPDEEYLLPDDFNIFPLVEKFTVRHHSSDMQYWAGVVMRNLCRKDDSHGGIRQCAYYQCGKWETYQRQFAKCRRCRRTKYCSKECQKSAWVYHRHWCVPAQQQQNQQQHNQTTPTSAQPPRS